MIYKPSQGRFKDTSIFWHDGRFYSFSMHTPLEREDFRNVWMATSTDGVHWEDIGAVIEGAPFNIWAMDVHQIGNKFIMNHGSFTLPGIQNVIRFWKSTDLIHWTFMGHDKDLGPDQRWYHPDSRLDCMSVVPVMEKGKLQYYGYATGPGGFLVSEDGLNWAGLPQPQVDWDMAPPPPTPEDEGGFEVGGCREINGKYYLVGGWFNYMGGTGYGVFTLVGDTPTGPFHADTAAYRLCGNSTRWVALWARFIDTDDELLVNGYMYSGYTYETGETWLPPLKKADVNSAGHLRLKYWQGNDALKGEKLAIDFAGCQKIYPQNPENLCTCNFTDNTLILDAQPERNSIMRRDIPTVISLIPEELNFEKGIVIEGEIEATCNDRRLGASAVGFYLEEKSGEGTAILLHGYGRTEIGKLSLSDNLAFDVEDVVAPGCAAPAGILPHMPHTFRLLIRRNMFELYLDDYLVQTFNTTHEPGSIGNIPRRIGFIAQNGRGIFTDIKIYSMTL